MNNLMPLHALYMRQITPILDELYGQLIKEMEEHKKTLQMFQKVVTGEIERERIYVSDDGWKMLPEVPKSQVKTNGKADATEVKSAVPATRS